MEWGNLQGAKGDSAGGQLQRVKRKVPSGFCGFYSSIFFYQSTTRLESIPIMMLGGDLQISDLWQQPATLGQLGLVLSRSGGLEMSRCTVCENFSYGLERLLCAHEAVSSSRSTQSWLAWQLELQ